MPRAATSVTIRMLTWPARNLALCMRRAACRKNGAKLSSRLQHLAHRTYKFCNHPNMPAERNANLIHLPIHAGTPEAFTSEQRVQELHMVPCGREDESGGVFRDDLLQKPQQGRRLVFLPAPIMHNTACLSTLCQQLTASGKVLISQACT
jgi:hypothetical protein